MSFSSSFRADDCSSGERDRERERGREGGRVVLCEREGGMERKGERVTIHICLLYYNRRIHRYIHVYNTLGLYGGCRGKG